MLCTQPASSTPMSHTDAAGNTYQRRRLSDGSEHVVLKNFPTASELRASVSGAASEVKVEQLEYYWVLPADGMLVVVVDPAVRLERSQWDFFWIPEDAVLHDRSEILFVSCPRDLTHLNAVTRIDPAHPDLDGLIAGVKRAHAAVRSRWSVPSRIADDRLHDALGRGGYVATNEHEGRAIEVGAFAPRPAAECTVVSVTTTDHLRDLVGVGNAAFGHNRRPSDEELEADLRQCSGPSARVHRVVAYANGRPVSAGGISVFGDLEFGFLWAGCTIPEAEGRGFYSAVVAARVAWAAARGLKWVGLYARTTTSSPIVQRQGFGRFGTMTYWERGPDR